MALRVALHCESNKVKGIMYDRKGAIQISLSSFLVVDSMVFD